MARKRRNIPADRLANGYVDEMNSTNTTGVVLKVPPPLPRNAVGAERASSRNVDGNQNRIANRTHNIKRLTNVATQTTLSLQKSADESQPRMNSPKQQAISSFEDYQSFKIRNAKLDENEIDKLYKLVSYDLRDDNSMPVDREICTNSTSLEISVPFDLPINQDLGYTDGSQLLLCTPEQLYEIQQDTSNFDDNLGVGENNDNIGTWDQNYQSCILRNEDGLYVNYNVLCSSLHTNLGALANPLTVPKSFLKMFELCLECKGRLETLRQFYADSLNSSYNETYEPQRVQLDPPEKVTSESEKPVSGLNVFALPYEPQRVQLDPSEKVTSESEKPLSGLNVFALPFEPRNGAGNPS